MYGSAISEEINFKYAVYSFTKPVLPSNVTSGVHYNTQLLPPDSSSALAARSKALVSITFASYILVISAPVLWNSLIWGDYYLCNCQNVSEQQVQWFYSLLKLCHVKIIELLNSIFSVVWCHGHSGWCSVSVSTGDIMYSSGIHSVISG